MKKNKLFIYLFLFLSLLNYSQQLVLNEVSQGPSGNKEYVELIVSGIVSCGGTNLMDLRNYIIDDNNGTFAAGAGVGIAQGCVRLKNVPFWSSIPFGTLILIYNDNDINSSVPANDLSMIDGNCKLVIPISDCTLLERFTTQPSTALATYPLAAYTNCGGAWSEISMANGGDSFQTVNPSGGSVHSVSWGNNSTSTVIYFAGAATGNVMYNTNSVNTNPALQANWVNVGVAGNETPGVPNNSANAAWINSMNNGCTIIQPFSITTASTNPGCTCNGLASVTPTGAISPYTFTWSPSGGNGSSATGLCAGIYTVTTTSANNCTLSATYTLTSLGTLTTTTAVTNPLCFGSTGSATVTPSGVAGPYTYTWTPPVSTGSVASGLSAGNYTVTVGAGGCTSTKTITIATPPASITVAVASTSVLCFGGSTGSAILTTSGGTNPYTYT